eukprot:SAG25_NODE_3101_length_1220_cov_1.648528_1_plen_84_part_00
MLGGTVFAQKSIFAATSPQSDAQAAVHLIETRDREEDAWYGLRGQSSSLGSASSKCDLEGSIKFKSTTLIWPMNTGGLVGCGG